MKKFFIFILALAASVGTVNNGQLFIEKNGKTYTVMGQIVR